MSPLLQKLIHEFQFLPGIGEKTAQRFVHHIFSRKQADAKRFADTLLYALDNIKHCHICQDLSESDICKLCASSERDSLLLCIVEHPSNVMIMEATQSYKGKYFVLHGALSPIDGIGPSDIGLDKLSDLILNNNVEEIIIATSSKIEGEATAYYIHDTFKQYVKTTRLAYGIPIGGSLDYLDGQTLARALIGRQSIQDASID